MTKGKNRVGEIVGAINTQNNTGAENTQMEKMHASQGHGFAAERANHLYDQLHGNDSVILGDDNAKNGADRMVDGYLIQSKYCQTASKTISTAFDKGQYRYLTPDGQPMQLEVPADQYEAAIEAMERHIANGDIPNITDPQKAKEIVRKGHFTYEQAQKLAQSNTIESLTYDAVNGTIVATNAFGITATITFALSCWNGDEFATSVENAVCTGLQVGGASFITSVAASQLARSGLNRALVPATDALVKVMGTKSAAVMANAFRSNANIYGQAAMNNVAKLLRCNAIAGVIMTVVLSAKDVGNAFNGRISGAQLFKNVATTAGGMVGGTGGLIAGTILAGSVGGFVGAMAGGAVGGVATNKIAGSFVEDDAERLLAILQDVFCDYATNKLLTGEETDLVLTELSNIITRENLMKMNASSSQRTFADTIVYHAIDKIIGFRSYVSIPSDAQIIEGIQRLGADYEQKSGLFSKEAAPSAVEIGKRLTGTTFSESSAKRAWYATKQMNSVQSRAENKLNLMLQNHIATENQLSQIRGQKDQKKSELEKLLSGGIL